MYELCNNRDALLIFRLSHVAMSGPIPVAHILYFISTVKFNAKNNAHQTYLCFVVGYWPTLSIWFTITSLTRWQSNVCQIPRRQLWMIWLNMNYKNDYYNLNIENWKSVLMCDRKQEWRNDQLTSVICHSVCSSVIYVSLVHHLYLNCHMMDLAPVPLTIFRSNSKFDQNLHCPSLNYRQLITT